MNRRFVFKSIGKLLLILAAVMVVPLLIALGECGWHFSRATLGDPRVYGFLLSIGMSLVTGTALTWLPHRGQLGNMLREGFAIVTLGWILLTLFGAIPLFAWFLSRQQDIDAATLIRFATDACFEIMSGFTTTGATILTDIEAMPRGILFWRSLTHWLGGMGIVTLALAIFPAFGMTAYRMFQGEMPGPTKERFRPRLDQTAKILWGVYALLTIVEAGLLMLGGMEPFDACCHAFATMATGGFSTKNASVGWYDNAFIEWVIIAFMLLAGTNFMIHYQIIFRGSARYVWKDPELRFYLTIVAAAAVIVVFALKLEGVASVEKAQSSFRSVPQSLETMQYKVGTEQAKLQSPWSAIRHAVFQVASITTTTGFCTADFDLWPVAVQIVLVLLMFFGGCAGSTGGGMKMIRVMVVLKTAWREVRTMVQPRLVSRVKLARTALAEKEVSNIVAFFMLFILLFIALTFMMSLVVPDFTTAVTSVAATICNVGPGLAGVGATETYAWIPVPGKWVLIAAMLLGRLEIFTVLIALSPVSWRR